MFLENRKQLQNTCTVNICPFLMVTEMPVVHLIESLTNELRFGRFPGKCAGAPQIKILSLTFESYFVTRSSLWAEWDHYGRNGAGVFVGNLTL